MAIKYNAIRGEDKRIHQCDIFENLSYIQHYSQKEDFSFELSVLDFPYIIILSQECDLEENSKKRSGCKEQIAVNGQETDSKLNDQFLFSLLCAPLYNEQHLFQGNHLEKLNILTSPKNSKQRPYIVQNREPRYHYIEFNEPIKLVPLIIDFKHYFSLSVEYLEQNLHKRVCSINPIFRERISQRFSNYLSRIGLPEENSAKPDVTAEF